MSHLAFQLLGMAASAVMKAWWQKQSLRVNVFYGDIIQASWPPHLVMAVVKELLCRHGCHLHRADARSQLFKRGDFTKACSSETNSLDWCNAPVLFDLQYEAEHGGTIVRAQVRAPEQFVFEDGSEEQFYVRAEQELKLLVLELNDWEERHERERVYEPPRKSDDQAPYAALNLKAGATWPEIQDAYREASKRYHPDRLTGQNVPSHLVELAVERFKSVTAAYQTLKRLHGR